MSQPSKALVNAPLNEKGKGSCSTMFSFFLSNHMDIAMTEKIHPQMKVKTFGTLRGTTDPPFLSNVNIYADTSFNVMFMHRKMNQI
jgi:hypothetical protein